MTNQPINTMEWKPQVWLCSSSNLRKCFSEQMCAAFLWFLIVIFLEHYCIKYNLGMHTFHAASLHSHSIYSLMSDNTHLFLSPNSSLFLCPMSYISYPIYILSFSTIPQTSRIINLFWLCKIARSFLPHSKFHLIML